MKCRTLRSFQVLLSSVLPILCSGSVFGQDRAGPTAAEGSVLLRKIEVVGTRIRRVDAETVQPVLVLEREELQRTGLTNLGDILQQLPQHVADLNTDVNNGGNGETRVDLRNLGAGRTLVLLNGHRYVTALDGAIDVASIPLSIVDRVEVLTDGASAIYGSDAIAGVVNIITRGDYEGIETTASHAFNEYGDGQRRAADLTWGRVDEDSSLAVNLSFFDQQPIFARDRTISAVPLFGLPADSVFGGAAGIGPNGVFGFGPTGFQRPDGGPGRLIFDPDLDGHRPFDPNRDGYNYARENYLRTPYDRLTLFVQGRFQFTPTLALRAEGLLQRRRSARELAPTPISQSGFSGAPNQHVIDADSLYNPFGQTVTFFGYRPVVRPRRFEEDVNTRYLGVGLDGLIELLGRSFVWDVHLIDARTRQKRLITGGYDLERLGLGVGPSFLNSGGIARCGTPTVPIPDCVPLNFTSGTAGLTAEMYDYFAVAANSQERRALRDLTIGITGDLFDLPAGPLAIAAGLEHRGERAQVDPDPLLSRDGVTFGGAEPEPVEGRLRVNEAYLELAVPLLAEQRFVDTLEASLAARHSRYSSFGNTTNRKFGLSWRPSTPWLVRASWSQGFRAPSTFELFALSSTSFPAGDAIAFFDPCARNPVGIVADRCRADGVPVGAFNPSQAPVVRLGSNPSLQPERADSRNLGIVYSPTWLEGLEVSIDHWRVELRDTIDRIQPALLGSQCYERGYIGACAQLGRDPATGALISIDARLNNYGTYDLAGYDLRLGYRQPTRWGDFAVRWDNVYVSRYRKELPRGAPALSTVGNYFNADPGWRHRSLLSIDWQRGSWGATLRMRHFPSLDESCQLPRDAGRAELCERPNFQSPVFNNEPERRIRAITYTDLQLRWQPLGDTRISLGATNLFDRDPPLVYSAFANTYDPSYDIPGRYWTVSVAQRW